jgi:hypothetical protein
LNITQFKDYPLKKFKIFEDINVITAKVDLQLYLEFDTSLGAIFGILILIKGILRELFSPSDLCNYYHIEKGNVWKQKIDVLWFQNPFISMSLSVRVQICKFH